MPEGPEIRRAADNLEAAIKGKPLTDVWFAFAQLKTVSIHTGGADRHGDGDARQSVADPFFRGSDALQP